MSHDSTKPPGWVVDDKFKPVQGDDVSDEKLLVEHVRHLRLEMHDGFDSIARALTKLDRIESRLDDIGVRISRIEKDQGDLASRVVVLEQSAKRRMKAQRKK